jgi:glucuronoarabinoxylan endo-1,4-beta-xylanase
VEANATPATNVLLSAYINSDGTQTAIVVVNIGTAAQTFPLVLDAGNFGTVTPYRTSATEDLAPLDPLAGGTSTIEVTVPGQSITTFLAPLNP